LISLKIIAKIIFVLHITYSLKMLKITYANNQGRSQDFSRGGADVMEAKALKRKNCL